MGTYKSKLAFKRVADDGDAPSQRRSPDRESVKSFSVVGGSGN